jgi:hypothetical protein
MSNLARLLQRELSANLANSANNSPKISNFSKISSTADLKNRAMVSNSLPLSLAQETARREEVLARLRAHPTVKRAFVTRFENDLLIVTLGVRDVGRCELTILAERVRSAQDYAALAKCLDQPEGSA